MNQQVQPTITVSAYYERFKSAIGFLTGVIVAVPLISEFLPTRLGMYLFPPLGDITWAARIGAATFIILTTFVAYIFVEGNGRRRVGLMYVLGAVFFALFLFLTSLFVRMIDIPSRNTSVAVSIGYHRTEFAEKNFPQDDDWEMLRQRGPTDEQVEKLWTPLSVAVAKLLLWVSCVGSWVAWTFTLCFGVLLTFRRNESMPGSPPASAPS